MDAFVESLSERLRSLSLSDLKPLPNATKLSSELKALEQIVSKILPALPIAVRQMDTKDEAKQLMEEVTKLADQLEKLLNELQSETSLARNRLRARSLSPNFKLMMDCFNPSFFITSSPLQERVAKIMVEFRNMEEKAICFSDRAGQPDPEEGEIVGRENDLRNIVERLLSDDHPTAVCIVGPPGIGKTTLARLACNDAQIKSKFVGTWVLVSDNFDTDLITRDLLNKLGIENPSDNMTLASLNGKLQERLSNRRLLLVLDRVPAEIDPAKWNTFMASLSSAAPGSRVLMTMTADANTISLEESLKESLSAHELEGLTYEDCRKLLMSVAFPGKNPTEYSHLEDVGEEMALKCEGHPLATKVMGRILRDEMDVSAWDKILISSPWEIGGEIYSWDSLFMSYDGLPAPLRGCFAYYSIFPKEYKVLKETLIQFWIAADLLQVPEGTTSLEAIAEIYLLKLQSKSFFLDSNEDDRMSMDPKVSALAPIVSRPAYYHYNRDSSVPPEGSVPPEDSVAYKSREKILHMSCIYDVSMKFEDMSRYKHLRTLLLVCPPASSRAINSGHELPKNLFTHFPELRSLSLSGLPMHNLPDSIGNLKQLRLLDLSHTLIQKLPETTTTLCDLLTLKLSNCVYIAELPSMENLIKLRHLDISGSKKIKAMPRGMGRLPNLRSLSDFIVRGVNESPIQELRDLVNLSGKLTISGLQNVVDSSHAKEANLASKTNLREIVLEWTAEFSELRDENVETEVLYHLEPHSNLEILSIICYGGTKCPEWISLSHKLVHVTLSNCRKCKSLPPLGRLPVIRTLSIEGMDEVKKIGAEFYGNVSRGVPFPSLERLEFKNMPSWEELSFGSMESKQFPRLRLLKIERCPKLKEFKVLMEALEQLTINECQELTAFENFPSLLELDIQYCSNLKEMPPSFPSLTKLRIWGCQELTFPSSIHATSFPSLGELDIRYCSNLKMMPPSFPSLTKLSIWGCQELASLVCEVNFPRLLELEIQKCTSLRELPPKFPSLEKLRIRSCKQLFKLSEFPKLQDLILEECDELMLGNEVEVSSLASMVIRQLPKLQCLSTRLINLEISQCVNLEALREEEGHGLQALGSLERLVIDGCPKLKQLPDIFSCFSSLKELIIMGCEVLDFDKDAALPPVLKRLVVANCKHLKSLPPKIFDSQEIGGLEFLEIYRCPSLVSLSECKLPVSLRWLSVSDCINLKSLPAGLNCEDTSLTSLRIEDCRSLENFPHDGLPCNIRSLSVINCVNLNPLSGWGLDELECLRSFSFGGCPEMVDLGNARFPGSVGCLLLKGLPKLQSLSGLLQNLNSLDILSIRDCPRLEILANEKLPDSLSCLKISNCPILKHRCKSVEGQDWSKIQHIPRIEFDFQSIR